MHHLLPPLNHAAGVAMTPAKIMEIRLRDASSSPQKQWLNQDQKDRRALLEYVDNLTRLLNESQAHASIVATKAQDVLDRWDTPHWKDYEPTAVTMNALRDALCPWCSSPTKCQDHKQATQPAAAEGDR